MNTERVNAEQIYAEKPGIRKSAARKPTTALSDIEQRLMIPIMRGKGNPEIPKTGIRAVSCLLACCLILMGILSESLPAYASERRHEAETDEISFYPYESGGASSDSVVTGNIKVELLTVVMPAGGLEFEVDPTVPFQVENPGQQILSPGIPIKNHSVVPVKVEISRVAQVKPEDVHFSEKFPAKPDQSFQLVDRISAVGAPGTAILVLGVEGKSYSQSTFEKDAIIPDKQNIFLTDIPAEGEQTLRLYGKVAPDFYGAYQFTVRPTLKISAVKATKG